MCDIILTTLIVSRCAEQKRHKKHKTTHWHTAQTHSGRHVLRHIAQTLSQEERLPVRTLLLTGCLNLQSPTGELIDSNVTPELTLLNKKTCVTFQWIPSHCGVEGTQEVNQLSKVVLRLEQSAHPMSYSEAKAIRRDSLRTASNTYIYMLLTRISNFIIKCISRNINKTTSTNIPFIFIYMDL